MYLLKTTAQFEKWLKKLKDKAAKARILAALKLLEQGHMGDWKLVGSKIAELRIHHGAGYRIYFCRQGNVIFVLLNGGNKASQSRDIEKAKQILKDLEVLNGEGIKNI
ncbi:type II toxin-antitoxin system RelE/ParE family toxin [Endozoicomonas sp. YOMI1]|uniref:type II toxin-antitoxin system RelE/ParE family toxin n=1 Tax=Endozoicomonas sp. YOMI1 TaxID=2828739 RepID=UPI0021476ECE|nr:type II toxin-antitoxin system RelE/ParE family toxin [Endozoicomonas sp. YOMI1]